MNTKINKSSKLFLTILSIVLIGIILTFSGLTKNINFVDVNENDYFYSAILWALDKNITNGTTDTTFSPEDTCTRAQIATFIYRAAGEPSVESKTNPFIDVKDTDYYYKAVLWAVNEGITTGTSDTTFSPEDTATREQIVTFLWRRAGKPSSNASNKFIDVNENEYYYKPILWAIEKGITNGIEDNTFGVGQYCTRGQAITYLYRYSLYVPSVTRFVVASDLHISDTTNANASKLRQLFSSAYKYADGQEYNNIDLFFFAGDFTEDGYTENYQAFNEIVNDSKRKDTPLYTIMGNHEHNYADGKVRFEENITTNEENVHIVVNGYHFIGISCDDYFNYNAKTLQFLKNALKEANDDDPTKPIFVFQHYHIKNTVYVSTEYFSYSEQSSTLKLILKKYPQVIDFSGHSHSSVNNPRAIWQGEFTAIETGTINYLCFDDEMTYGAVPPNASNVGQYLIVEITDNSHVEIKPYNIMTDDFFKTPSNLDDENEYLTYIIDTDKGVDGFKYIDREENADTPYFEEDAEITIVSTTSNHATISIPQAKDNDCIFSYQIVCSPIGGGEEKVFKYYSEYYFEPLSDNLELSLADIENNIEYSVSVFPIDCYGKKGEPICTNIIINN